MSLKKGKIIDLNGNQIGEHEGIINYKFIKGKALRFQGKALYVININADNNTVIVGNKNLEINQIQ